MKLNKFSIRMFWAFTFLLGVIIVCHSCSKGNISDDDLDQTIRTESISMERAQEFKELNDSLLLDRNYQSRGFWSGVLSFCAIAGADAAGAYEVGKVGGFIGTVCGGPAGTGTGMLIGGLIGGAGASYAAYCTTRSETFVVSPMTVTSAYVAVAEDNLNYSNYYPQQIELKLPEEKKELQIIGAKHNLVLEKLSNQDLSLTPVEDVLTPLEYEIVKTPEFENGYYAVLNKYIIGDYNTYVEDDGSTGNIVMKLYLDIINKYPEKVDDVEFVSNKYIELIANSSELTDEEKDCLYSAISVAVSSFEFWQSKGL